VSFLLDTNVISEWTKPRPDRNVISWLAEVDEDRVFISVISFAEVRHGIERLPPGRKRERLARWLAEELPERFENRILAIDQPIDETWVWSRRELRKQAWRSVRWMPSLLPPPRRARSDFDNAVWPTRDA
jgi:predicted nucleic acid-binding protein